ncbi:hypothetical protein C9925_02530 [cyanobacterium G8-9]|nr:hypothetical protein C9925_02530 [cyanobacterium G8-9]
MLELLSRYDVQAFLADKTLELRTLDLLTGLETATAQTLREKLSQAKAQKFDTYRSFHKLNAPAIAETLAFFKNYENIVSYKIPSRGRTHYKHLQELDSTEAYNYQESQYPL